MFDGSDDDFALVLSDDESDETNISPLVETDVIDVQQNDITSVASSSVERRHKLLESYVSEKEHTIVNRNINDDSEIICVVKGKLKQLISTLTCSNCGQQPELDIARRNLDVDLNLKCDCKFPDNIPSSTVKPIENVKTDNIGEISASFVYQNILNGVDLAALNNTTCALGAAPFANSTYQRYKSYVETLADKKYNEMIGIVDEAVFQHYENMGFTPDEDGVLDNRSGV